jgi:hypothetical protein
MRERASVTPVSEPKPWPTDAAVTRLTTLLMGGKAGAQMATRRKVYRQYGNRHEELASRYAASYMDRDFGTCHRALT